MSEHKQHEMLNDYAFTDGVLKHAELGERFQVPPAPIRNNVGVGHFVELRVDSPRFSTHADADEQCQCGQCHEPAENPILCHEQPASFLKLPKQKIEARGWGEQFWAQITQVEYERIVGRIDNILYESNLHGLHEGDEITFHKNHILAVHPNNNREIILGLSEDELTEFGAWLDQQGL